MNGEESRGKATNEASGEATLGAFWDNELLWAVTILFLVVLVGMPIYSYLAGKRQLDRSARLKGLNLPEGSIRGMLALMSVGSFIIVLVLGPGVEKMKDYFDQVVTAFGTLTGAIIGFYFGNRGTPAPAAAESPRTSTVGGTEGGTDVPAASKPTQASTTGGPGG